MSYSPLSALKYLPFIFAARFGTLAIVTSIFLPPDAQNPHATAQVVGLGLASFMWAMADLFTIHAIREKP